MYKIGNYETSYKTLEKGTVSQYSALSFDKEGQKLASVGGSPDYMLTIWDWENQTTLLRTKAFGQVGNGCFSNYARMYLTSHFLHIRKDC